MASVSVVPPPKLSRPGFGIKSKDGHGAAWAFRCGFVAWTIVVVVGVGFVFPEAFSCSRFEVELGTVEWVERSYVHRFSGDPLIGVAGCVWAP